MSDISEYVIIKNKYLIVAYDNILLILDIQKEIIINKILILCSYTHLKLFNFNFFGDTYFLVYEAGNIYLLKFKEKNNEIKIKGFLEEKRNNERWILHQLKTTNEFFVETDDYLNFLCN